MRISDWSSYVCSSDLSTLPDATLMADLFDTPSPHRWELAAWRRPGFQGFGSRDQRDIRLMRGVRGRRRALHHPWRQDANRQGAHQAPIQTRRAEFRLPRRYPPRLSSESEERRVGTE